jgi:hypothetical protein
MNGIARCYAVVVCLGAFMTTGSESWGAVPAEYRGTWVANLAACSSTLRVTIGADRVTLINPQDSQSLGDIEMAGPGYFPPDYRGVMAVLITEFSGHQPVTITFNLGEKKGVAQIEFAPVMPGSLTAQGKAYNAHIAKLNLAKRFALNKVLLKKCAGA